MLTASRKLLRAELIDWLVERQPTSIWTLGFHYLSDKFIDPQTILMAIKRDTARIALEADQHWHRTRFVTTRVHPSERLEGICFPEKLAGAGHVHIALLPRSQHSSGSETLDDFLLWQLQHLVTTPSKLDARDRAILDRAGKAVDVSAAARIVKSIAPKATSHIVSVHDAMGIAEYVTKEFAFAGSSAFENFFVLSEFHSQRRQAA